jgi:hypothetical protein
MDRIWIFMIFVAYPVVTLGQGGSPRYQPAVPAPATAVYGGGGWGYGGGAQTAQGAALQGMSQVIDAAGQYNLATSAAAINMTEAQSNMMRNQVQGVQTFWDMRNIGREERAKERLAIHGPPPAPEELARRARDGAPRALSADQIDPVTGALRWPGPLQDANFQSQRGVVDEYTAKWVKYGALDYAERTQVRENIDTMFDGLKSQITSIAPQDYVSCRTFLQSLLYATTRTTL